MTLDALQQRLGYRFSKPELLQQALTHRSHSAQHNERLEFLGDSVLNCAVADGIAKQIPWAIGMIAVLTPTTRPRLSTKGPPLLPGLRAASVWMMLSISLPVVDRNERARLLTTPAVTVY